MVQDMVNEVSESALVQIQRLRLPLHLSRASKMVRAYQIHAVQGQSLGSLWFTEILLIGRKESNQTNFLRPTPLLPFRVMVTTGGDKL